MKFKTVGDSPPGLQKRFETQLLADLYNMLKD